MTTRVHDVDFYVERIKNHLRKKYPRMTFDVAKVDDREIFLYFENPEPIEDWFKVTQRAGDIVTDALVDDDYRIYVMPAA